MKSKLILAGVIFLAFVGSYVGKVLLGRSGSGADHARAAASASKEFKRVISLAPSITEILFTLELGDRVVGVTRHCDYPPEALGKEKVGGYYDHSYEAIVSLEPDLVVMLPEHEAAKENLAELGLNVLLVDHDTIRGILASIETIGRSCGVEEKAQEIIADIEARMKRVEQKTKGLYCPRVMVSVGRNMGSGTIADVYIAGRHTFYNEIIILAGGTNTYTGETIKFPSVSTEGILRLNPQVIIDMIPDLDEKGWSKDIILKEWETVSAVDAVKNHRVHVLGHDYVTTPGPRFTFILEEMAKAMHPEVEWR